jgi:hypothetical protein
MSVMMKEGKRYPGSEWLKDRVRFLERFYDFSKVVMMALYPIMNRIAPHASERLLIDVEKVAKGYMFNCQMCGQCILHSTGMTCPMNCPKNLRNGPCGGVREDGNCEVIPERPCIWVQAWERSQKGIYAHEIGDIQPPVNRALKDSSAWINMADGSDMKLPAGWVSVSELEASQR